ncbi:MAG: low molecular weight phosphatase family protein [Epsilonproteobacteria bacterium]|nr:low molecular weight phosphatase family protein [Campylobacterota bacterium]NPA63402.1 arsenate reductase ArsC [Campylobacterota bacterium]
MKRVLVLCTGNSCRSIIAEALINAELKGVLAQSAGSRPKGSVHPYAKKLLQTKGIWQEGYRSKGIEEVSGRFDLVVSVCDDAKEACPTLPGAKALHIPFDDPDGKEYEAFEKTFEQIRRKLLPKIKDELGLGQKK